MWILEPNHDAVLNQHESKQQGRVPGGRGFGNHPQLPHIASSFSEEDRVKQVGNWFCYWAISDHVHSQIANYLIYWQLTFKMNACADLGFT